MVEFAAEQPKNNRTAVAITAAVILILAGSGIYFYARYQKNLRAQNVNAGPIVIPGMVRPGNPNFEYYKNKIRIENVHASLGITFGKARIALISYVVSNEGDRQLEALELRITLYDVYDKLSKERITTPVRTGPGPYRPMEPLEKRAFSVGIEAVEQLWNPKRLELEIAGLKYK